MVANMGTEPYSRRRIAGLASREETRTRLLRAADELFRDRGYLATTVTAIAERAGVSLQTLYLAWGSKSALFRAAADAAATASGIPLTPDAWREAIKKQLTETSGANPTAQGYLSAVAHLFVQVAARTSTYWHMQPGAASSDPEIADGYANSMRKRRVTMEGVAAAAMPLPGLRHTISNQEIADMLWSLASPEMFSLFTTQGGRTAAEFETWLVNTLTTTLCEPR